MSWLSQIMSAIERQSAEAEAELQRMEREAALLVSASMLMQKAKQAKRDFACFEARRAIKECYPDRWQDICDTLGLV